MKVMRSDSDQTTRQQEERKRFRNWLVTRLARVALFFFAYVEWADMEKGTAKSLAGLSILFVLFLTTTHLIRDNPD